MRECLYHPVHGYYSKAESKRFADYYTSVDVHPIFARLLAQQFAEMWESLSRPREFMLVEGGAGVGRFAAQVLDCCERKLPDFYAAMRYVAVERSASRLVTGSRKSDGGWSAVTCSRSTMDIPRRICLTSTTCAGRCLPIKTIGPAKISMLHRESRI